MFVHPLFDYLLIGGGLSLIVIPLSGLLPENRPLATFGVLPWFLLLSNSAHFAASTVRLYTKEGTRESLPFMTGMLPAIFLAMVFVSMLFADLVGRYLLIIYLTWSPYHYSAQAFGLSVMYCYRSGFRLTELQKRCLWWVALLPFFKAFLASSRHFLPWTLPPEWIWADLQFHRIESALEVGISIAAMAAPLLLFAWIQRTSSGRVPLISLLIIMTNAVWFVAYDFVDAMVLATVFHGIQYLAIVVIFHVKEQMGRDGNRHGPFYHALWFYVVCVGLGFSLFNCWPIGNELLGFDPATSTMIVIAAINIHHFVVDSRIWKLERDRGNRKVLIEGASEPVAVT